MPKDLDILIVEDELIIAEHISLLLKKEGYNTPRIAQSYTEAIELIQEKTPSIVLTDISLGEEKTGVDLGQLLNTTYRIPFIYITSLHSPEMVKRASLTRPNAYLVKPFKKEDLMVSIELALALQTQPQVENTDETCLVVKDSNATVRIPIKNIVLLKAEENYTAIYTNSQRPRFVRQFLSDLQNQLPAQQFLRIHRSYIVNKKYIAEIHSNYIVIDSFQLPVSRSYRHLLNDVMG